MARAKSNVIADCWLGERRAAWDLIWIVTFSALTALLAQIKIPLPFTPVPLTAQTFAVLLAGAVLGSPRAFLSQVLYLAAGAAGLPVFAGGASSVAHLLGPTGGYLWSYPVVAGVLGWLVERGASRKTWKLAGALFLCDLLILLCGTAWLHAVFSYPFWQAWALGFLPFLAGDILKIVLVGISLPRVLERLGPPIRRESSRS